MVKKETPAIVVIGDLVRSRDAPDRANVHARLRAALDAVNDELSPDDPLRVTAGDEYQGTFGRLGDALAATLRLRLALLPELDVRHGIGEGPVVLLQREPRVEDGPGWWVARAAIEEAASRGGKSATREVRTAFHRVEGLDGPEVEMVNAALIGRDGLVGAMSGRSLSVLRGLLAGRTQQEIAAAEGVSASAVSQRVRNDGVGLVVAMDERMRRVG
ncbi:MAG: SatD family protein [Nocardioides sp.]|nr:SatD family protein [Nocardioides sp.]